MVRWAKRILYVAAAAVAVVIAFLLSLFIVYPRVDYAAPLDPPLEPDDAAWADQWLRSRGLRKSP